MRLQNTIAQSILPDRLLQRADWFTQEKACRVLTAILESRPAKNSALISNGSKETKANGSKDAKPSSDAPTDSGSSIDGVLNTFVTWLCAQLRHGTPPPPAPGSRLMHLHLLTNLPSVAKRYTVLCRLVILESFMNTGGYCREIYKYSLRFTSLRFIQPINKPTFTGL
jgi:hypothetical protein